MTDEVGILQNDPNNGLRVRLEPGMRGAPSAQESLAQALNDLQELARDRLAAPDEGRRRRRSKHRR